MDTLTAQAVLQTWEQAQSLHPLRRSRALLGTAWPEVDPLAWGAMPVGAHDACLFRLQDLLFGSELDTVTECPACHETLQTRFSTADLCAPGDEPEVDGSTVPLRIDGFELTLRLPSSDDLLAISDATADSTDAAVGRLISRCVLDARCAGSPIAATELPQAVIELLQQEMARRDRGADTTVALDCPGCGHAFVRRFDIGSYLWDELDDWAQRTIGEVHLLASAYGWSEAQILALSAARRRHYIALVQA